MRCFFDADAFGMLMAPPLGPEHGQASHGVAYKDEGEEWYQCQISRAIATRWTTKGLQHEEEEEEEEDEIEVEKEDKEEAEAKAKAKDAEAKDADADKGKDVPEGGEASSSVVERSQVHVRRGASSKGGASEVGDAAAAKDLLSRTTLVVGLHPDQAAGEIAAFADRLGLPWCIVPCCVYSKTFTKRRMLDGTHVKTHAQLVKWLMETYPRAQLATLDFEGKNQVVYCLPIDPQ
jgi:hypothetical protein